MDGQILTKLENIEKELKELKSFFKKTETRTKKGLTLTEISERLKIVGKAITPKELEQEIRAVRAQGK